MESPAGIEHYPQDIPQKKKGKERMKKNAKRLLGLLIALAMMVSLVGTMALADSSTVGPDDQVTYIGTSVSSGFFLKQTSEDWEDPDVWNIIVKEWRNIDKNSPEIRLAYRPYDLLAPRSAPRLVAEGLGMTANDGDPNRFDNFHKMCFTGLRTSELLRFLYGRDSAWNQKMKDDWISESYMGGRYSDFTQDDVDWLYDNAQTWIEDSKYVIVEIGANDVMTTVIENLFNPDGYYGTYKSKLRTEETYQAMLDLAMKTGDPGVVVTKALELAKKAGELPLMMTAMTKALLEGTKMFYTNYGKVIQQIYKLNPKATVLAVGTFNPLDGVKISNQLPILEASLLMDPNIRMMNAYIKTLAPYALSSKYDYRYVDDYGISLSGIDKYTLMGLLTSDKISEFDATKTGPIHPNEEGHRYLASQILKAINK